MRAISVFSDWPFAAYYDDLQGGREGWTPKVNILKKDDAYRVIAQVPGVKKEDLTVEVKDGTLTISARYAREKEEGYETIHQEISDSAEFRRSFRLDADRVETDSVNAHLENGVLEITLPLKDSVKPKQIEVRVE